MDGKKIVGWLVRDGIAAVDGTSLPWGLIPLYHARKPMEADSKGLCLDGSQWNRRGGSGHRVL